MEPIFTMTIVQGPLRNSQRVSNGSDTTEVEIEQPVYKLNNVTGSTRTTQVRQQMEQIISNLKEDQSIPSNYIITDIQRRANRMTRDVKNAFENDEPVSSIIPNFFLTAIPEVNFVVTLRPPSGGRKSRRKRKTKRFFKR
jgi:hypothetical protein